ncbi:MAG TPA: hypothetical protein EYQ54_20730, partial [Myxococcales bacterium]|nr:hypothetical protein [Myxococcales bacterium]
MTEFEGGLGVGVVGFGTELIHGGQITLKVEALDFVDQVLVDAGAREPGDRLGRGPLVVRIARDIDRDANLVGRIDRLTENQIRVAGENRSVKGVYDAPVRLDQNELRFAAKTAAHHHLEHTVGEVRASGGTQNRIRLGRGILGLGIQNNMQGGLGVIGLGSRGGGGMAVVAIDRGGSIEKEGARAVDDQVRRRARLSGELPSPGTDPDFVEILDAPGVKITQGSRACGEFDGVGPGFAVEGEDLGRCQPPAGLGEVAIVASPEQNFALDESGIDHHVVPRRPLDRDATRIGKNGSVELVLDAGIGADFNADCTGAARPDFAAVAHDAVGSGANADASRTLNVDAAEVLALGEESIVDPHRPGPDDSPAHGPDDGQRRRGFVREFSGRSQAAIGAHQASGADPGRRQAAGIDAASPGAHLEPRSGVPHQAENRVKFVDDLGPRSAPNAHTGVGVEIHGSDVDPQVAVVSHENPCTSVGGRCDGSEIDGLVAGVGPAKPHRVGRGGF